MQMTFEHDEDGIRLLAVFLATLVKEGVVFKIHQGTNSTVVELTGGF